MTKQGKDCHISINTSRNCDQAQEDIQEYKYNCDECEEKFNDRYTLDHHKFTIHKLALSMVVNKNKC